MVRWLEGDHVPALEGLEVGIAVVAPRLQVGLVADELFRRVALREVGAEALIAPRGVHIGVAGDEVDPTLWRVPDRAMLPQAGVGGEGIERGGWVGWVEEEG